MKTITTTHDLIVKKTRKMGRGVFANREFRKGETIEICPIILIAELNEAEWKDTSLADYVFGWGSHLAIVLGFGSLYNHSKKPNASRWRNQDQRTMNFFAYKNIHKGQQIFIDYGWGEYTFDNAYITKGVAVKRVPYRKHTKEVFNTMTLDGFAQP